MSINYKELLQNTCLWIWEIDLNFSYTSCSDGVYDFLGISSESLINKNFYFFIDKKEKDRVKKAFTNSIINKTPILDFPITYIQKNSLECSVILNAVPVLDENGEVCSFEGYNKELAYDKKLHDKHVLETRLKAAHQQQIIEEIHDSVISTDLDGKIIAWNSGSEVLLGYRASEVIGKHISFIYLEEELSSLEQNIKHLMEKGQTYSTVHLMTKSKKVLTCNLSLSILRDENSIPIGMVGYSQDITDMKKAEDTLAQQARMVQMGEMLSMIAHQWRQPLNAISLTSANLRLKFEFEEYDLKPAKEFNRCKEDLEEAFENIEEYIATLSTTINDFKNFYATDKKFTLVKLENIVNKAMDIIGISFSKHKIELLKEYTSDELVEVYENELMQVILNILKNAEDNFLERNIENPVIKIIIKDKKILISDNGGGIESKIMKEIFDPYFSTKAEKNGTGLGLYLSKIIVEEHHKGNISVENRDNGACFKLEFI